VKLNLDLDLLRTFSSIADTRSLTRTAAEVGRTQSAISMQVRRIEEVLEGPVLHRGARGVELTARGERLLVYARRLLRLHDEALIELTGGALEGTVRLGCPDDYCVAFLPALLRDIATWHPKVLVEVVCAATPALQRMLDNKSIDLAIVSRPDSDRADVAEGGADVAKGGAGAAKGGAGAAKGGAGAAKGGAGAAEGGAGAAEGCGGAAKGDDDTVAPMRREALVWVGATDWVPQAGQPLQLALSEADTLDHRAAIAALEALPMPYRIAYASASMNGLLAIARSGIAIAVLTESAVPADLKILSGTQRLPALPVIQIAVASRHQQHTTPLALSLKKLIAAALPQILPAPRLP
jgi:DNA-binding transcriptional LysR family regulator